MEGPSCPLLSHMREREKIREVQWKWGWKSVHNVKDRLLDPQVNGRLPVDLTAIPGILYQIGMDGKLKYLGFLMKVLSANHMPRFLNLHSLVGIHLSPWPVSRNPLTSLISFSLEDSYNFHATLRLAWRGSRFWEIRDNFHSCTVQEWIKVQPWQPYMVKTMPRLQRFLKDQGLLGELPIVC